MIAWGDMEYFFSLFSLSKSATTTALNWSELALLIFGIVLVAGLVGEYRTLEPHSRRMKVFEMLVIIGVLGELLGDGGIFVFSNQLQTIADAGIAVLNNEAAQLRKQAEELQMARVKIEARVAWRSLSKEQQSAIAAHLKQFAGLKVGVSYLAGSPDASPFADNIAAALRAANWKVFSREPFTQFGGFGGGVIPLHPSTGVNLSSTRNRLGRDADDAIQRELCSMGFDTTITGKPPETEPNEPKVDVEVLVVGRPAPAQGLTELMIDANTATITCRASQ
jgi:hypothetical protein